MMELKSTLDVFNEADVPSVPWIAKGQAIKSLVGSAEHPSERIMVALASFEPGTYEELHWHLVEKFYYVISGRAVMKDIEGKTRELRPGSVVYAPPGIAASHSWHVTETLQLISVRASTDPETFIQFDVDLSTKQSSASFESLVARKAVHFRKSLY